MPARRTTKKPALAGAERAARKAAAFLRETREFRLTTAIFGNPVRRQYWIEQLTAQAAEAGVHLTHCQLPATGEPRLLHEIAAHLRDIPTHGGQHRAVIVTGLSPHLFTADVVLHTRKSTPALLAQANFDRELFPIQCPHPLIVCLNPTTAAQFRRLAPDLAHWTSHTFDFSEPTPPGDALPVRSIGELQAAHSGTKYANREELLRAISIFQSGLDAAIATYGKTHPETIGVRSNLANAVGQIGRRQDTMELELENLAIAENAIGFPAERLGELLDNTGLAVYRMGDFKKAEPLLRRALEIDEASYGNTHPAIARDLNNLAQLLQTTNRLAEAEPLMRRALEISEASYGQTHPTVAIRLNNLAQLLKITNRFAEAEPLMRRALEIDEASYGRTHPDVAIDLNNLAQLLQATNRLAEAESLIRQALEISEASYGKTHPTVASSLNNLATLLKATNRLAEAEPLLRRALEINKASYGKTHPAVAISLSNLATLLQATNRLAEAEPLMGRALEILTESLGSEHPSTRTVRGNFELLQEAIGEK